MECYICLTSKYPLIQPGCLCKTIYIHPECYKTLLKTYDIMTCSICKSDVSVDFVKQYATMEQLLVYPYRVSKSEDDFKGVYAYLDGVASIINYMDDYRIQYDIPGITYDLPYYKGAFRFRDINQKNIVMEAHKREWKSLKQRNKEFKGRKP